MIKIALIILAVITCATLLPVGPAQADALFGPKTYTRTAEQPNTYSESFINCEPQAKYQLAVENGDEQGNLRLSSAEVKLNGQSVLSPSDLNQNVANVIKPVSMQPENVLDLVLAGGPDGQLRVSIECVENCFNELISSPVDHSSVIGSDTVVKGTVTSSSEEIGIMVNGMAAQAFGSQFAAAGIRLGVGENTITAYAANACGQRVQASVSVQVASVGPQILLDAHPAQGVPPMAVTLHTTSALDHPVVQYQWDLTGDGTIETSGAALTDFTTTYDKEGLYFPTVLITDDQQNRYSKTAVVYVFKKDATESLILKRWNGMKAALQNKDVEGALAFFAESSKEMYRQNFTVMKEILPQMAADMGTPRFVRFVEIGAVYEMQAVQGGREYSFHVEFVKDYDGLWKIRFF